MIPKKTSGLKLLKAFRNVVITLPSEPKTILMTSLLLLRIPNNFFKYLKKI